MSDEHAASACTTESDGLLRDAVTRERSETTVGRALLSDPNWVVKVRDGRHDELAAFDRRHMAELT